jgi:hypothetical protein
MRHELAHPSEQESRADEGPAARARRFVATLRRTLRSLGNEIRAMLYGASGFEFEREAARIRGDLENLFIFLLMGDELGVPVLPPYYTLRLLPYLLETIPTWKRRLLRERHPLDSEEFDLHGL